MLCAENIVILDTRAANSNSNGHNRVDMWMALVCNAFSVLVRETILRQHNAQMHKKGITLDLDEIAFTYLDFFADLISRVNQWWMIENHQSPVYVVNWHFSRQDHIH